MEYNVNSNTIRWVMHNIFYDLMFTIIYHLISAKKTIIYKIIQNLVINEF